LDETPPLGARGLSKYRSPAAPTQLAVLNFGWFPLTGPGFAQSVSAIGDTSGRVVVFAVTPDHSLFVHQDATGWSKIGAAGTIELTSLGTDQTGQADIVAITAANDLAEYRVRSGWSLIFPPSKTTTQISASAANRLFMTLADGSVFGRDPSRDLPVGVPGFAHSSREPADRNKGLAIVPCDSELRQDLPSSGNIIPEYVPIEILARGEEDAAAR
jgi:hypothetical protein